MYRQPALGLILPSTASLVTIESARVLLAMDEDSVLALIDRGRIRWAWDIAVRRGSIREVRIWAQCLVALQQGADQPGEDLKAILPEVIGVTTRTRLRASEVRAALCCSQQHIQRLVSAGEIDGDVEARTRWVMRESLERFLEARRIE